jgi:uncharacterized protein (DUF3084 family)
MKCTFYLYGFVFSALVALLIFFNSKKGLEKQAAEIEQLEAKIEVLENKLENASK